MSTSGAHLMADSTLMERDGLSLETNRPETSIILPSEQGQASSGLHNSKQPLQPRVLQPEPASMISRPADLLSMDFKEPFAGGCLDCTKMCGREDGASREIRHGGSLGAHCFYKRVSEHSVEGGPSCWMEVPAAFVHKYLPNVDRKGMVLENADGKAWPVGYSVEHGFYRGWAEFSTANQLAIDDLLVFSFVEQAKFVVRVFCKSGCEKHVPTDTPQPNPTRRIPMATQSHAANPAPASECSPRGFARPSRPDADSGARNTSRGEWDGFRTPAAQRSSYGATQEPDDLKTTPQTNLSDPDWRPEPFMSSRGTPASSDAYKFLSQSVPAPRTSLMTPSWCGKAGPSTCHNLKLGRQGDLRDEKKQPAWSRRPTWSQIQARLVVTRAKLRKMNITPLPMSKHQRISKGNRNPPKKRTFRESLESDGEVGFDASSGYDGEPGRHRQRTRRSNSREGALNLSSLDNLLSLEDEEMAAEYIQRFLSYRAETRTGRFSGAPSRHHEMADSFDKVPDQSVPEYVPEYVQLPRKPGRPRKSPLPATLPESSDGVQGMVVKEKAKRGRPFKHQVPGDFDMLAKPMREIFISRRRSVTQAEKDEVVNAAYSYASHLKSSTNFVVVMRQSFVYRNFVLGVPRKFAQRYMPGSNAEVTLVDKDWNGWTCSWNAGYKYMSGRGWRNFAIEHCVEEDDALLMEILTQTEDALTIKVHIFRVVPIPDGQTGWDSHVLPPNCHPELNSGVPIQPVPLMSGKRQPRLRMVSRHLTSARGKRIKREPMYYVDESTSSDSSEELD